MKLAQSQSINYAAGSKKSGEERAPLNERYEWKLDELREAARKILEAEKREEKELV